MTVTATVARCVLSLAVILAATAPAVASSGGGGTPARPSRSATAEQKTAVPALRKAWFGQWLAQQRKRALQVQKTDSAG
ncbi:MAG: hypothetical protein V4579_10495 [Pseudomonadota bacterium]